MFLLNAPHIERKWERETKSSSFQNGAKWVGKTKLLTLQNQSLAAELIERPNGYFVTGSGCGIDTPIKYMIHSWFRTIWESPTSCQRLGRSTDLTSKWIWPAFEFSHSNLALQHLSNLVQRLHFGKVLLCKREWRKLEMKWRAVTKNTFGNGTSS